MLVAPRNGAAGMTVMVNEGQPLTYLLADMAMLGTIVLAWRAYRHSAREGHQRKIAIKRPRAPDLTGEMRITAASSTPRH